MKQTQPDKGRTWLSTWEVEMEPHKGCKRMYTLPVLHRQLRVCQGGMRYGSGRELYLASMPGALHCTPSISSYVVALLS